MVFLHVPTTKDEEAIRRGVEVALALIQECIDALPGDYRM